MRGPSAGRGQGGGGGAGPGAGGGGAGGGGAERRVLEHVACADPLYFQVRPAVMTLCGFTIFCSLFYDSSSSFLYDRMITPSGTCT